MYNKGLLVIFTGSGKGKSSAAIGLAVRAAGNGKKVCILQFLKSPDYKCGERDYLKNKSIEIYALGIGFTWSKSKEELAENIQYSWEIAKDKINSNIYDMIILDEFNVVLDPALNIPLENFLTIDDVVSVIKNRPGNLHIVMTGRNANEQLMELADVVTEFNLIKHHFDKGISAVPGIEF